WVRYRAERRPALTVIGAEELLKKLVAEGPLAAAARIERSVTNGWQGLFFAGEKPPAPPEAGDDAEARRRQQREEADKQDREDERRRKDSEGVSLRDFARGIGRGGVAVEGVNDGVGDIPFG